MKPAGTEMYSGYVTIPQSSVYGSKNSLMVTRKAVNSATGTAGVVSWNIEGTDQFVSITI